MTRKGPEGGLIIEFLGGFQPITSPPPARSLKVEDSNHTSKLLFGTFNWVGTDRAVKGETKTPKPKSQTRGSKEVAVAEEGKRE